jgi:hypothetical protein
LLLLRVSNLELKNCFGERRLKKDARHYGDKRERRRFHLLLSKKIASSSAFFV